MRRGMDILVAALLAAVLVWCGLLFLGAFSQHRLALLSDYKMLSEIKTSIVDQAMGHPWAPDPKAIETIDRLEKAQRELFDTNTVSFLFAFITLLLVTMGTGILGLMYRYYRRSQERAEKAEARITEAWKALPLFMGGVHTAIVVAAKYVLLYELSLFHRLTDPTHQEILRILMSDYLRDIRQHLADGLQDKQGLEPRLHDLALDMAMRMDHEVAEIDRLSLPKDKSMTRRLAAMGKECLGILWDNGIDFRDRYAEHVNKIRWEDSDTATSGDGGVKDRGRKGGRSLAG